MRHAIAVPLIAIVLAGCAAPRPAPVVPPPVAAAPPRPAAAPAPVPRAADWNDWPFTPGDWRYLQQPGASASRFDGGGRPPLTMTCDRFARQIRLTGLAPGAVTIRTTSLTRTLTPTASTIEPAIVIAAADPLLDAIAFSRGRFVVEQPGQPPLVLPPYAEIGRVIEDCRG